MICFVIYVYDLYFCSMGNRDSSSGFNPEFLSKRKTKPVSRFDVVPDPILGKILGFVGFGNIRCVCWRWRRCRIMISKISVRNLSVIFGGGLGEEIIERLIKDDVYVMGVKEILLMNCRVEWWVPWLIELRNLESVQLNCCQGVGVILGEIGKMSELRKLCIMRCGMEDGEERRRIVIRELVGKLKKLKELRLNYWTFGHLYFDMRDLECWSNLRVLEIVARESRSQFNLRALQDMEQLEELTLMGGCLVALPNEEKKGMGFLKLTKLDLTNCRIMGHGVWDVVGEMKNLRKLILTRCEGLAGEILSNLVDKFEELRVLDLRGTDSVYGMHGQLKFEGGEKGADKLWKKVGMLYVDWY